MTKISKEMATLWLSMLDKIELHMNEYTALEDSNHGFALAKATGCVKGLRSCIRICAGLDSSFDIPAVVAETQRLNAMLAEAQEISA